VHREKISKIRKHVMINSGKRTLKIIRLIIIGGGGGFPRSLSMIILCMDRYYRQGISFWYIGGHLFIVTRWSMTFNKSSNTGELQYADVLRESAMPKNTCQI
jgi:hypothetical protein